VRDQRRWCGAGQQSFSNPGFKDRVALMYCPIHRFSESVRPLKTPLECLTLQPTRPGLGRNALAPSSNEEGGFRVRCVIYDQRQVCRLPGQLCPPCSAGLAVAPPESLHLGCPPLCTLTFTRTSFRPTTAQTSRQQHSPRSRPTQAAVLLHTHSCATPSPAAN
jgi:hypothetical protein